MSGASTTEGHDHEPKDRPFDPWRFAKTESAQRIVTDAVASIEQFEVRHRLRNRARKAADQETFVQTVSAVLCDLIHHRLYRRPAAIYVTRSHKILGTKNRYRPAVLGKQFPKVLDRLEGLDWLVQDVGEGDGKKGKATTILAGKRLLAAMDSFEISMVDIGYAIQADPIVLKRTKEDFWDNGGAVEYEDTDVTMRFRQEMREINRWLRDADIECATDRHEFGPIHDSEERSIRRIFTQNQFDRGGRLFGGFWQPMGKDERFDRIIIDGEAVAEIDYSQMVARQLYGFAGTVPSDDDAYSIPGFEGHRKGVKRIFSAMVFADHRLTRMPRLVKTALPPGTSVTDITDAIEVHHADIADQFYLGIGHRIQFQESQIMVDVLLHLKRIGIVALPIHDAVLVPASQVELSKQAMLEVFKDHVGLDGQVDVRKAPSVDHRSDLTGGPHGWGPSTSGTLSHHTYSVGS